jgi:KUP system potassium uptake protein
MAQGEAGGAKGSPSEPENGHVAGGSDAATHGKFWGLLLGSIGVVYGDIGTSPLYALRESLLHVAGDTGPTRAEVIGIVSLIFWALIIIVTLKYVFLLMRLDNKGEGGTVALMALAQRALGGGRTPFIFVVGLLGAALFYGDALITPAISVLSAVEGLKAVPMLEDHIGPWVLPISIAILIALFAIQSRGTGLVGRFFGPITAVWFLVMGGMGLYHLSDDLGIHKRCRRCLASCS